MFNTLTYWIVVATSVVVFWLLPRKLRLGFLFAVSWGYLVTIDWQSVAGLSVSVAVFYLLAPVAFARGPRGRRITALLLLAALAYLAFFKYVPPLIAAIAGDSPAVVLMIPLGISYFTFKLIHYGIEVGRGNVEGRSLDAFLCYIFLFPIFSAGPIERFDHFLANRQERLDAEGVATGLTRIIHGLAKKFVVAELLVMPYFGTVSDGATLVARLDGLQTHEVWGFLVLTYLTAYLDFSAYSDIAIGTSRLYGLKIMENFNWPVLAPNIGNFWKRWHMTLAGWCQAYVYMPTIGLTRNPYLAVYATFIVMGLWHAGSLNWVMWGLWHATGVAVFLSWSRVRRRRRWTFLDRWPWRWAGIPITFVFVAGGFSFTATYGQGAGAALRVLAKMLFIELPA